MANIQLSLAVAMILLGAAGALAGYLGALGLRRRRPVGEETAEEGGPIPPVLVALYLGTGGAMIGYLLWAWLTRPNY
jgi:hypothetical protein